MNLAILERLIYPSDKEKSISDCLWGGIRMKTRLKIYEVLHEYKEPAGFRIVYIATDMEPKSLKEHEMKSGNYNSIKVKKIGTLNVNLEKRLIDMHEAEVKILFNGVSVLRELFKIYGKYLK